MMRNKFFTTIGSLFCIMFFNMTNSLAQYQPLYKTIPNNISTKNQEAESNNAGILIVEKVSIPSYQYFRVASDNTKKPCVIICPGGGYAILAAGHEGSDLANYFNSIGVNAIVLKYRIPNAENQIDKTIAPLQDAQQAMLLARTNAENWGIDKNKIGVMGFSAGGHLAASLATHYNDVKIENPSKISLRPDFQLLIYPVISFGPEGHEGSRINLIGNFNSRGLIQDSQILRGLLTNFYGENLEIRRVQHILPECPQAELNIFLEVINPALFIFASKNIYLPNIEWTYKTWIPYLKEFDEIWVKTLEAQQIFSKYSSNVKFLGWTSIDKEFKEKKNIFLDMSLLSVK